MKIILLIVLALIAVGALVWNMNHEDHDPRWSAAFIIVFMQALITIADQLDI